MNYQEFIDLWQSAWRQTRFQLLHALNPVEAIDIHSMDRTYNTSFVWPKRDLTAPFSGGVEISWTWNALLTARSSTTEEDFLMETYGEFGIHEDTEPPWLRIDIIFEASCTYSSLLPLPLLTSWQNWIAEVNAKVNPSLPQEDFSNEGTPLSYGWRGEPEAIISFGPQGETYLQSVCLKAWQGINLPRQWDDPAKVDLDPETWLFELAGQIQQAFELWMESLELLIEDNDLEIES